jgi:putative aldouronate transport system permease protein
MYGIQIAFKDFSASKGIWGSDWVGMKHFVRFFHNYQFWTLIRNTVGISGLQILVGFPMPILFALLVNEIRGRRFKKSAQSITFMPHFLSNVVLVGMVMAFLSPSTGLVNHVIRLFGGDPVYFMTEPALFKPIYVLSDVWQNMGFSSVLYIAVLAGIDKHLYEAAMIDGASKLKRLIHIAIPCLVPTAVIMFIFQFGTIMDIGFEKIYLMQNDLNRSSSSVISTYVYEMGLLGSQFSFSAAVGLFNSVINMGLILIVNQLAKRAGGTSLW